MFKKLQLIITLMAGGLFLTVVSIFAQGPLTPPGAPAPLFKTLEQIESRTPIGLDTTPGDSSSLYIISKPGSYYFTGDIKGVATKHGITITTGSVTIDLNGFQLIGVPGSLNGTNDKSFSKSNMIIKNGVIRNWGGVGLDANAISNMAVESIVASDNGSHGISCGDNSSLSNCAAFNNDGIGIATAHSSVVSSCAANENRLGGIVADAGSTVSNCAVRSNTKFGIITGVGCLVIACSVDFHGHVGDIGIRVTDQAMVTNCVVRNTLGIGISAGNACTIKSCNVTGSEDDGIVAVSNCLIEGNNVANGDADGIQVSGAKNRIDSNNVTGHDEVGAAGIRLPVGSSEGVVVRNNLRGNTTGMFIFPGLDHFTGPLVTADNDADFANPWANFSNP